MENMACPKKPTLSFSEIDSAKNEGRQTRAKINRNKQDIVVLYQVSTKFETELIGITS